MKSHKFAAVCHPVREVTLHGSADLQFWRDHLAATSLRPKSVDGHAHVLIIAGHMRYMGITFTEVSFSVELEPRATGETNAVYLLQAFNSSRLFTFCERTLFLTPYRHADCRLATTLPASIIVQERNEPRLHGEMSADSMTRHAGTSISEEWQGEIFLPYERRRNSGGQKFYIAQLSGHTTRYPFKQKEDVLQIFPSANSNALKLLRDSNFEPVEWLIRDSATHSRTKTYRTQ